MITLDATLIVIAIAAVALAWHERRARLRLAARQENLDWENIALRRTLSQLSVGFVLLDDNDVVRFQNQVADDILGAALAQYWGAAQHVELVAFLQSSKGMASGNREIDILKSEGKLLVNAIVLEFDNEHRVLLLQNLEAEAQAHLRLREFVANASHELKTPIAAIVGMLDLLPRLPSEKRIELTERLQRNATSLTKLVDDLLTLSRAETTSSPISPQPCDVVIATREIIDQFQLKANFKRLTLELDAPDSLITVVDGLAFSRVIHNLVENALTYTESGGVTVRLIDNASSWMIEVEDSGPGIESEHIPQLFQRFFRVDAARSRKLGGTGLGLSIVRNFVERMGGTVEVESAIDKGSVFRVELPK